MFLRGAVIVLFLSTGDIFIEIKIFLNTYEFCIFMIIIYIGTIIICLITNMKYKE